ncbi:hypothetical protein [Enterobacillus tribolii]|uniref:Carbohydrate-binding family V/XII n=1 Tax=Enterobacillus tribolii TaxID=1487935 RepID=A0A370Q9Y9_9GAMM|nr:hypothetical protein [Enterobacillus tribolii]MBW7984476.1 hypothetical protein [Enterobacillus tribolii]RDK85142.1 hypothetical protein C8D90_11268 [Enterobacillus tribolii]
MRLLSYLFSLFVVIVLAGSPPSYAADDAPWPRSFTSSGTDIMLHQPQLDGWQGNKLQGRLVMAVKTGTVTGNDGKPRDKISYGVAWFSARTDTDKERRQVTLSDINVSKVNFPTDAANQAHYLALLRQLIPHHPLVISLDQLESDLAIQNNSPQQNIRVDNSPPDILFAFQPTLLVMLDGQPAWQATGQKGVERAINTRSLLLRESGNYYIWFSGQWYSATALTAAWAVQLEVPAEINYAMQAAIKDTRLDTGPKQAQVKPAVVQVVTKPAELIQINGDPQFMPIAGTRLSYVANTASDVFIDDAENNAWYALISGRWFRAETTKGPWQYVDGAKLPADFAKIPSDSPKSAVLASVPGTPEAREALIANAVPQTAAISRSKAALKVSYDGGAAKFKPIAGTPLKYAWNADVPVIEVDAHSYFAVKNGVWFSATAPSGVWKVAASVPAIVYTIPPDSPLHYVTYVRIYGSNDDTVYVGYTPGYYGTVVSGNVVVYGTGYPCNAWVGNVWYSCPATYGYGSSFAWDPAIGWSFGFISGWMWGSYWNSPGWGPWSYNYPPYPGYWGGGVSVYNVYNHWGNTVAQGVRTDWSNPWTGNHGSQVRGSFYNQATGGHGYGYAGKVTNDGTGITRGAAGNVRFNPETGRAVADRSAGISNPGTGNAAAVNARNSVNVNTGRETHSQSIAGSTPQSAGKAGSFTSLGAGGAVHGSGYVHYDKETGQINHGGAIAGPDGIYAGHDGAVYQHTADGWQKMDASGNFVSSKPPAEVSNDYQARQRGGERLNARQNAIAAAPRQQWQPTEHQPSQAAGQRRQALQQRPAFQERHFDRSNYEPRFRGRMGGRR